MAFELKDRDLLGRIGRLRTQRGDVETPVFMPVINPINQLISPRKIFSEFKNNIVITNSYIIKKNLGENDFDVHQLLDFPGIIMTDSGAYQILVYGGVEVSQPEIIKYQRSINSDISVILDIPTGWDVPRETVEWTVEETLRRAKDALPLIEGSKSLWVGPVQGGQHLDLVTRSAKEIGKMPFHIHALGSPTEIMERYMYSMLVDMIITAKRALPPERPLHLFGAGHPIMFSLAVALGCDLFDSASYALYAKDDRYLTPYGTLHLEHLHNLPCACPICSSMTADELKLALKGERERLLAEHNLYICLAEIRTIKQAINEGSLWNLVEIRSRSHPSLAGALKQLKKYKEDIEAGSPGFKSHGSFIYGFDSLSRPEITRHRSRVLSNYSPPNESNIIVLVTTPKKRPYNNDVQFKMLRDQLINQLGSEADKLHICFYAAPFGVIPLELSETYPLSQYDIAEPFDIETIKSTAIAVADYVKSCGLNKCYLYRGLAELDNEVEETLKDITSKFKITLKVIRNLDPWIFSAYMTLIQSLKSIC